MKQLYLLAVLLLVLFNFTAAALFWLWPAGLPMVVNPMPLFWLLAASGVVSLWGILRE